MFKKIMCALSVWAMSLSAHGQATLVSTIYRCIDSSGQVRLTNIKPHTSCVARTVRVPASESRLSRTTEGMANAAVNDPQPAKRALIVGTKVPAQLQIKRDAQRMQILQSELTQAQTTLKSAERLGQEGGSGINTVIDLTQDNIKALQREIARE